MIPSAQSRSTASVRGAVAGSPAGAPSEMLRILQVQAVAGGVGELQCRQHLAEGGRAVGPGHLEVDQVGSGRDPGRPAALAAAGDQPGHEGAVAVGVGEAPLAGQVGAGHHPAGQVAAGRDPGVEHPDPDAPPPPRRRGRGGAASGRGPRGEPRRPGGAGTGSAALTCMGRSASVTARTPGWEDSSSARSSGTRASRPPTIGRAASERPPTAATASATPSPWTRTSAKEREVGEVDRASGGIGSGETSSTSDATSRNTPVTRAGRPLPAVRTRTGCT